ncbi:MAG: hypothetical protein IJ538_01215 [Clostridia bacterium]|nr:hypothetical protein [Clostridia bacterium]
MKPTNLRHSKKTFLTHIKKDLLFDSLCTAIIFVIMIFILTNPQKFTTGTVNGIKLFFNSVLPGLFPFMLLTKMISEIGLIYKLSAKCNKFSNKIFGTPGISLYAFISSIMSGYPIGAKIISELYSEGLISEIDAKKMIIFCTTSGPIFVIGAVGAGMLNNVKIGAILFIVHITSSMFLAIICNFFSKHKTKNIKPISINNKQSNIFSRCINDTINSLFVVCANITIFSLIIEILDNLNVFKYISNLFLPFLQFLKIDELQLKSFLFGIVEITRGIKSLSCEINLTSIVLIEWLISFSGISIIMQSLAFLKNAKIKVHEFILIKLMHAFISATLCFLVLIIFQIF